VRGVKSDVEDRESGEKRWVDKRKETRERLGG